MRFGRKFNNPGANIMKNKRGFSQVNILGMCIMGFILMWLGICTYSMIKEVNVTRDIMKAQKEPAKKELFKITSTTDAYVEPCILTDVGTGKEYVVVRTNQGVAITPRVK